MTPIFDESEGLIYRIELWTEDDQHVDALLAKCARIAVAYGALDAAIAEYPGRNVTLRQRTRRDEEGLCYLLGCQSAHLTQGERNARFRRESWMTARKN